MVYCNNPNTLTLYSKDNTLVMVYCNNPYTLTFYSKDNTLVMVYCNNPKTLTFYSKDNTLVISGGFRGGRAGRAPPLKFAKQMLYNVN
jgi:hypothetical protein